ncbi:cytochrome b [Handroanthus impetiginosus]|uniref:Cytochrome b n=1 Tax=Handroanthus impetiginosus TaxID=429701 RepID=A0A2G9FW52_9LAMI|nr:cytochrome b [Handroanthus impetiginosus]
MGFILGMCLTLQIITGIILSINYVSQVELSFDSVIHIIRDVEIGAITRYTHINGASLFFIIMFIHIGRGATVITSIISAIPYVGKRVTQWVWGNFSVSQPTLNRFFSLHYLIPIIIMLMVIIHLILLHQKGSSNPTGTVTNYDKMKFFPYFLVKDIIPLIIATIIIVALISTDPNNLGDVENFNKARISTTPPHIQPE